jgi:hypothetical protein
VPTTVLDMVCNGHNVQELAGLSIMAAKLEEDKAVLEQQLEKARRAHAELCAAGKQLAAAESTIRESTILSMNSRAETPDAEVGMALGRAGQGRCVFSAVQKLPACFPQEAARMLTQA